MVFLRLEDTAVNIGKNFVTIFILIAALFYFSPAKADDGYSLLHDTRATAPTWVNCIADLVNQVLQKTTYKSLHQEGRISWSSWSGFTWYRFTAIDSKQGNIFTGGLYAKWEGPSCSFYQTQDHSHSQKYISFVLFDSARNTVLKLTTDVYPATFFEEASTAELEESPYLN